MSDETEALVKMARSLGRALIIDTIMTNAALVIMVLCFFGFLGYLASKS